jgi:hypothetical protein
MKTNSTMNILGLLLCTLKAAGVATIAWGWCIAPFAVPIASTLIAAAMITRLIKKTTLDIAALVSKTIGR